jgi:hypothetical protein
MICRNIPVTKEMAASGTPPSTLLPYPIEVHGTAAKHLDLLLDPNLLGSLGLFPLLDEELNLSEKCRLLAVQLRNDDGLLGAPESYEAPHAITS